MVTGGDDADGTMANASIVFIGTEGVSEKIPLELIGKDGFAPGSVETFSVEAPDGGEIKKIEVCVFSTSYYSCSALEVSFKCWDPVQPVGSDVNYCL